MGKISNVTNSNDPTAVNARIFVGNLNTFVLTKDNVENIFKRYGTIVGISMHKGYAFVQYATEAEARNAVLGEDQRVYATQPIDVNMTAEPKPNRPSRKRPPTASTEWDYFYNLPVQRINNVAGAPAACTPLKRTCPDYSTMLINTATLPNMPLQTSLIPQRTTLYPLPGSLPSSVLPARKYVYPSPKSRMYVSKPSATVSTPSHISNGHIASPQSSTQATPAATDSEDILICGKCKSLFRSLSQLTVHKKLVNCKPACDCSHSMPEKESRHLKCATCQLSFQSCWLLLQHCQTDHSMHIFTEEKDPANDSAVEESSVKSSSPPASSMLTSTESLENY